jgi:hypothetical protein
MNTVKNQKFILIIYFLKFLVEKPIKNSDKFFSYISKHFKNNRPDITFKEMNK